MDTIVSTEQRVFTGVCQASFGELLQGVLPGGEHFLVTLPISSTISAFFYPHEREDISVYPINKNKTCSFVNKIKERFNLDISGTLVIESPIAEGKGLSSSTADMVAALRSIECYCKSCFESKEVDKILRLIEPSDGLLYPGSNLYYHRKCEFGLHLGVLPRLPILSIDFGGVIDTIAYNKKNIERSFDLQLEYQALLEQLYQAFQTQDIVAIGAIATKSAILNQEFHYKKELLFCIDLAKKHNAYGIVNTHSGTCLGFLLDASLDSLGAITADLLQSFPDKNLSLYYTQ